MVLPNFVASLIVSMLTRLFHWIHSETLKYVGGGGGVLWVEIL
jgi:hypothetical protein